MTKNSPNMVVKSSSLAALWLYSITLCMCPVMFMFMANEDSWLMEWSMVEVSSCVMSFAVLVDSTSLVFSLVVCLISASVMLYTSSYMAGDMFLRRFTQLVLLFILSMNFLIFIPSLPALLLGWDGLGIVSFALVIYYQNNKSLAAGMLTIMMNRIGDVMILISVVIMVLQGHWLVVLLWDTYLDTSLSILIVLAGMTKSAQLPFSSWLPAAMAAPTPVSALVHSSTLVTAGVYLLVRFERLLLTQSFIPYFLLIVSVLTLLMAGIAANYETDLKKVIALSTLSQLGVMFLSYSLGSVALTLFHLFTHALFKALLFLCAGMIIHSSMGVQDLRLLGVGADQLPLTTACLNVANLSLCGMPFLSGFYSKDLILELSLGSEISVLMLLLILVATGATAAYSARLSMASLWGNSKEVTWVSKSDTDIYVVVPTLILSVGAITSGYLLQEWLLGLQPLIMLPSLLKLSISGSILLGVWCGLVGWELELNRVSLMIWYLSSMWFLVPLSGYVPTKGSMKGGTILMKSVDQGWLEILGGQGMFSTAQAVFQYNQWNQAKTFNNMVFLLVSLVVVASLLL